MKKVLVIVPFPMSEENRALRSAQGERPVSPIFGDWKQQLRCLGSVTPRHQLVQLGDLVICDTAEDIGEPGLGINAVKFGCFDQGDGNGLALPPRCEPTNNQFFLPSAIPLIARSAVLLSSSRKPFSR